MNIKIVLTDYVEIPYLSSIKIKELHLLVNNIRIENNIVTIDEQFSISLSLIEKIKFY